MIQIDGDYLEGGGQIIRTSLSLSAITKKSFKINNVRAGRSKPGLKEQHIQSVNIVAMLCNAKHNAKFGSTEFDFKPEKLSTKKKFFVKVGTAGSTALILSTIMPVAYILDHPINVNIDGGGTWNLFAPSILYLQKVLLPLLRKIGFRAKIIIKREGFYPKGGAKVELSLEPWTIKVGLDLTEYNIKKFKIFSVASESLKEKKVAERQLEEASKFVKYNLKTINYADSMCAGSGILIVSSPTILAGDAVGRKRKTSEEVAREATKDLQLEINARSGVDHRAADQLMIYMALSGGGTLKTSRISNHARTNAYVIEKFLPVKFEFGKNIIKCFSVPSP